MLSTVKKLVNGWYVQELPGSVLYRQVQARSAQLFVIGVVINHRMFPCVFALITRQNKPTFTNLFQIIKKSIPSDSDPTTMIADFDMAAISAFKTVFPSSKIAGYSFFKHF